MIFLVFTFFSLDPKAQKKYGKASRGSELRWRLVLLKMIGMKTSIVAGNS